MAVTNIEIVTFAVFTLGGASKVVDTEDVAIEAHSIAPSRFSWNKHPNQVNLELVRVFLSDAKKRSHGWLSGSGKDGWSLTPKGLAWVRENSNRIEEMGGAVRSRRDRRSASPDETRWRREFDRLNALPATRAWLADGTIPNRVQALEVFRIDSYVKGQMRDLKITRLLDLFADDSELVGFVEAAGNVVRLGDDQ